MTLQHNGRVAQRLTAGGRRARIEALLGDAFVTHAALVDEEAAGVRLTGFAVRPAFAAQGANAQYVFVNGRFVRDRVLSHALREAYRDVLHHERQPTYALWLTLDPRRVDVNVHPQKTEVRFRDSGAIHQFVRHADRARAGDDRGRAAGRVGRGAPRHRRPRGMAPDGGARDAQFGDAAAGVPRPPSFPTWSPGQRPLALAADEPASFYAKIFRPPRGRRARAAERRRPSARLRARAAARHLHPRAEPRGPRARRHARRARAHRLREAQGVAGRRRCRCSRCSFPRRSSPSRWRWPRPRRTPMRSTRWASRWRPLGPATLAVRGIPAPLADADPAALARAVLARNSRVRRDAGAGVAPRRDPVDDGLPRRRARTPQPRSAGDERAAARDGGDRALGAVQPWPADVVPAEPRRSRSPVHARALAMTTADSGRSADGTHRRRQERAGAGARRTLRRRDRQRRLGAGVPRDGHRNREARRRDARAHRASPDRHRRTDGSVLGRALRRGRARRHRRYPRPRPRADRRRRHDAVLQGADGGLVGRCRRPIPPCARRSTHAPCARAGPRCMPSSCTSTRRPRRGWRPPMRSGSSARWRCTRSPACRLSELQGRRVAAPADLAPTLRFALMPPDRAALHAEIARRFDAMLAAGLVDELAALRARHRLEAAMPSMRCVGYRQAWDYLDGTIDLPTLRARGLRRRASSPSGSSPGCARCRRTRSIPRRPMRWPRSPAPSSENGTRSRLSRSLRGHFAAKQ